MHDELALRTRMIDAGLWLSVLLLGATGAWVAATWDRPHRGGLLAMAGGAALATAVIALLPRERIVRGRHRELLFLGWSLSLIVFIAVAAGLDDGVRSPIVLTLFLTLVYAALSYPRWAVSVVAGVSLLAVVVLSRVGGHTGGGPTDPVYFVGLMLTLAVTGTMCIYQARIQEQARAELARVSRADPLTGALNRLGFGERIEAELRAAQRAQAPVALVVLDFDHFKAVNDRLGHAAGDELLCWAAGAMRAALRPGDALARMGGDEFAVLLPRTALAEAHQIADRLQLALSLRVATSAGAASTEADGASAEALHHEADRRLYAAKRLSHGAGADVVVDNPFAGC
jgi:diguanylate cyclase (GGDEF)-like protein